MKPIKPTWLTITKKDGSKTTDGPFTYDTTKYLMTYVWKKKPNVLKVTPTTKEPENA